jgi:sulfate adenylyltransferase
MQLSTHIQQNPELLIRPYGGVLVELTVGEKERADLAREATKLPSLQLSPRSLCDLELLAVGAFSPVRQFMNRAEYLSVLEQMRLPDGTVWPIPITLPVANAEGWSGKRIALRSPSNHVIAIMQVEEIYESQMALEQQQVLGTTSEEHCLVAEMHTWGKFYLSGPLKVLELPRHYDYPELRRTPAQVRQRLEEMGNSNVVAFQTRNPMHRAHEELTKRAQETVGGSLLLHPVVGVTRPGDVEHFGRVQVYKTLTERYYDPHSTVLGLLPLAMRMAGPREALWHAIIRRNFGATHLIIGRHHASPDQNSKGRSFYGPYEAHELLSRFSDEIGVQPALYDELVYIPDEDRYEQVSQIPKTTKKLSISNLQVRTEYLAKGKMLPAWFTRPETAAILAKTFPPRSQLGLCIWFTGLPSAGKSTIAEILAILLSERGRRITMLDGDVVRTHLSKGLGFTREDRDVNIRRIGFVASEITRHNGTVICAVVSPFNSTRNEVRDMAGEANFALVYVKTPLEVCEQRDAKGFYAKARAGDLKGFTGVDDPYEPPSNPDITLETLNSTPEENARKIVAWLLQRGFIEPASDHTATNGAGAGSHDSPSELLHFTPLAPKWVEKSDHHSVG